MLVGLPRRLESRTRIFMLRVDTRHEGGFAIRASSTSRSLRSRNSRSASARLPRRSASSPPAARRSTRAAVDRLEHPEALVRVADEALVDEGLERVESGSATCSAASRVEPPRKTARRANRSRSSCSSRSWLHSIVARRVVLAGAGVPAALEQVAGAVTEPVEERGRGEDAGPGGGQLDSERQVVEPAAELRDRSSSGSESGADAEQLDGVRLREAAGRRTRRSPSTRRSSRDVTRNRRFGHVRQSAPSAGAASTTCSKLSSTSSSSSLCRRAGRGPRSRRASARRRLDHEAQDRAAAARSAPRTRRPRTRRRARPRPRARVASCRTRPARSA